jgi:serine/threonine-protein phosphatase 2B catalytic subunit
MSQPQTPAEDVGGPGGLSARALEEALAQSPSDSTSNSGGPPTPSSPISPFRRKHGRHASLGTTMTSPSTRRRSLENTMSLLKEAADGKERDEEFEQLADQIAGGGKKHDSISGRSS